MSEEIFIEIFGNNAWGSHERLLGPGSERADCDDFIRKPSILLADLKAIASGSAWLPATTTHYRGLSCNMSIPTSQWTPFNLETAPFFLPPCRVIIGAAPGIGVTRPRPDEPIHYAQRDRSIALWLSCDVHFAQHQGN